jgi:hypothetical protein
MGVSFNSSRRADRRHTCAAHARTCTHSPAVLSAAEANGSRRSAAAEAAAAGEDTDPAVGWGLSAGDIEEAVGFHTFSSSSSSPTSGSGRVHAVEEVKCQFNPWLLILNDSTEIRFFFFRCAGCFCPCWKRDCACRQRRSQLTAILRSLPLHRKRRDDGSGFKG